MGSVLSYICMESFFIFFLYTWTSANISFSMKGSSWGHYIIAYAFLCSSLLSGLVIGRVIHDIKYSLKINSTKGSQNSTILTLAFLFFGIANITRYSILIILYFFIGLFAANINNIHDDLQKNIEKIKHKEIHSSNNTVKELEILVNTKKEILIFIFATLFSSILYSKTIDVYVSFPAFNPSFLLCIILLIKCILNYLSNRSNLQRFYNCLPMFCRSRSMRRIEGEVIYYDVIYCG